MGSALGRVISIPKIQKDSAIIRQNVPYAFEGLTKVINETFDGRLQAELPLDLIVPLPVVGRTSNDAIDRFGWKILKHLPAVALIETPEESVRHLALAMRLRTQIRSRVGRHVKTVA